MISPKVALSNGGIVRLGQSRVFYSAAGRLWTLEEKAARLSWWGLPGSECQSLQMEAIGSLRFGGA
jgi:hypothetical protein